MSLRTVRILAWLMAATLLGHSLLCACRPAVAAGPRHVRRLPACCAVTGPYGSAPTPVTPDCPHCRQTLTVAAPPAVDQHPAQAVPAFAAVLAAVTVPPLRTAWLPQRRLVPHAPPATLLRQHCALTS